MDHNVNRHQRLFTLAALLLAGLLVYAGLLFDAQVNDYDYYMSKSIRSIARKETVTASRGIITDRSGRPMVANRSTYALTFDTSLLKDGEDENEAILRLVEFCRDQGVPWLDTLPISKSLPFVYTLDEAVPSQKRSFLIYLKSLDPAKEALRAYLLDHPDAVGQEALDAYFAEHAEEDNPLRLYLDAFEAGTLAELKDPNLPAQAAKRLLELLDADHLTAALLTDAGIPSPTLLLWMQEDFALSQSFTLEEARLVLGVQYELSWRRLDDSSGAYVLAEDIDTPFITMLSDGAYSGSRVTRSFIREYETTYAAHILGTVGKLEREDLDDPLYDGYPMNAIIGKSGVEAAFEPYLQGKNGTRVVATNSEGKVTDEYYSKEPQPGNTVELTIDLPFQQAVEGALDDTISAMNRKDPKLGAAGGAAVVKVGTGEVLALASYPTYDPADYRKNFNELLDDPSKPLINRATTGRYPPGSTLKPMTSIAALQEGLITPTEKIYCPVTWHYPGDSNSVVNCWLRSHPHGKLNVSEAITASCNYFFAEMGYRLGMDRMVEYMSAFGFGAPTGIEIGDSAGQLPSNNPGEDRSPWAAIGQANMAVTPLQLANYIATLVSGGQHYETHLLKAVKSYDNSQVVAVGNTAPINTIDIAPSSLEAVKKGMHGLTKGTLAPYFKDCIVEAGAKTGTAQLGVGKTNNGVFVCFAPYDDPEIAVAIAIEKGGAGSALASTAVNILNAYFSAGGTDSTVTGEHQLLQ